MQILCPLKLVFFGRGDSKCQEWRHKKEKKPFLSEEKLPWKPLKEMGQFQNWKEDLRDPEARPAHLRL